MDTHNSQVMSENVIRQCFIGVNTGVTRSVQIRIFPGRAGPGRVSTFPYLYSRPSTTVLHNVIYKENITCRLDIFQILNIVLQKAK